MNEFSSDEWKVLCKSKLKLTWLKPTKQKQEAGWMEREADCNNQILSIPGILARCSQLHLQNPANQGHARKQTQQQTEGNTHSRPCENSRAVTVRYSNIQLPSVVFKPRVWRFPKQMRELVLNAMLMATISILIKLLLFSNFVMHKWRAVNMAFSAICECKCVWVQASWNLVTDVLEIQFLRALHQYRGKCRDQ